MDAKLNLFFRFCKFFATKNAVKPMNRGNMNFLSRYKLLKSDFFHTFAHSFNSSKSNR